MMPIGVSSAPYAKYPQPGVRHGGEIVAFRIVQTIDMEDRRPQYLQQDADGKWVRSYSPYAPDGKPNDPICQWEITVDTGIADEHGDTELRIFVDPRKGRKNTLLEGKRGGDAVNLALKKAKAHRVGLEIGGTFHLISGEKIRDGVGPLTNTWTAEYQPPPGGPGTGTPLDETPWLVGGGRYDKQAELAKWEAAQAAGPGRVPAVTFATGGATTGTAATTSAPVASTVFDDEPPF